MKPKPQRIPEALSPVSWALRTPRHRRPALGNRRPPLAGCGMSRYPWHRKPRHAAADEPTAGGDQYRSSEHEEQDRRGDEQGDHCGADRSGHPGKSGPSGGDAGLREGAGQLQWWRVR
ncbi:hypothetical protein Vwe01_53060 [Micromonospora andamanensis]|nr:hypothetical protein Vwe01_53060 [Micromonospora andamanensis]